MLDKIRDNCETQKVFAEQLCHKGAKPWSFLKDRQV